MAANAKTVSGPPAQANPSVSLSNEEILRYSRHLIIPEVGMEGQLKLKAAKVLLVEAGGLGAPSSLYLAAAGVGRLGIVDFDKIDHTNLQRQVLFSSSDVGTPKIDAAAERLHSLNPDIQIDRHETTLSSENALDIFRDYDIVVDGTDNFETRYLINDYAVKNARPWVYGAAVGSYGISMAVIPLYTACLRCVYPDPPAGAQPTCETAGVLGSITALIASLQVSEAIKILCGVEPSRKITTVDVWSGEIRQVTQPGAHASRLHERSSARPMPEPRAMRFRLPCRRRLCSI